MKYVALADLVGPFPAGERRLAEGDVADQVEGVEVLADLVGQGLPEHPLLLQLLDDELLLAGVRPGVEEGQ